MTNKPRVAILIFLVFLITAGIYMWTKDEAVVPVQVITTFEECRDAGYPIMESYPEQCRTAEGKTFVREIPDPTIPPNTPTSKSGVRGIVMLGPTCPVVQNPPDSECDDRPFRTNLVLTSRDGSSILKSFSSDAKGEFSVAVSPGSYLIRSAPGGPVMPSCSQSEVIEVKANSYTAVTISCDSGIR